MIRQTSVEKRGTLFVVSAPSGGGKRTVLSGAMDMVDRLNVAVSATTRPPRAGEKEGEDYYFLDRSTFEWRIKAGDFVEWAEVHGNLYGTLKEELDRRCDAGSDVILELDVQGMRSVRKTVDGECVTVFIMPPSMEELESRLRKRGANDAADMALRLTNARAELDARFEYDYLVVNDKLEEAVADFVGIVRAERCRVIKES